MLDNESRVKPGLALLARCNFTHCPDELIEVRDGCVDVWGDTDAVDLFVVDSDGVDLVAVEECRHQLVRGDAFDADAADGAGESWVERGVQLDAGELADSCGPVVL